jgi:CRISPR-associated endonuclease/helicase Cas3
MVSDKRKRPPKQCQNTTFDKNSDNFLDNAYVMHLARLSLMLADHTYSALAKDDAGRVEGQKSYPLFANTDANGSLKQQLDEHLLGVEKLSGQAVYALPEITNKLPRLARHRGLRKRSSDERFRWQDKAAEMAESIRTRSEKQGAFIVNMASTGCGKTLANVRVMYGLSDPTQGMRCAFALGLRTLTRQTAKEYRERLNLGEDEIAALVGGTASSALMKHFSQKAESTGSESLQDLLPEDGHVFYEGTIDDRSIFKTLLKDSRTKALLSAPVLVCTIDHLIPATEGTRGGRQIAPMLRLLSGDVVMDELDDYSIEDLPAVTRLMHWAGLLGSRVLISSATLPPELTVGMFNAYYNGRMQFQRNRAERPNETLSVSCIWIDEFGCSQSDCATSKEYSKVNQEFVEKRIGHLSKTPVLRRGELVPLLTLSKKNESFPSGEKNSIREGFANVIRDCILRLHQQHHETDPKSGKRVSFGVVRMSNIDPLFDVAQKLYQLGAPENHHIHLCVYHSQFPLLSRSAIESQLDKALDRRQPSAVFTLPEIRKHIDSVEAYAKEDQIFVVLSSPVTEVGRDHDYDWAVVEPSSMRSIIQIAGRVRRHRKSICETPNLLLLDKNVRSLEHTGEIAYTRPGYESTKFPLASHSLSDLLREEEFTIIDARPRIVLKQELHSQKRIADLEHARLRALMTPPPVRELSAREIRSGVSTTPSIEAHSWWTQPRAMMSGILQQRQPFRRQLEEQVDLVLLPNEENDDYLLYQIMTTKYGLAQEILVDATKHTRVHLNAGKNVSPWGNADFITVLDMLAEELNMAPINCARRFATITLPQNPDGWRFHPALGFAKYRPALNRF